MVASVPEEYIEIRVELPKGLTDAFCDFVVENLTSGLVLEDEEDSDLTGVIFYLPANEAGHIALVDKFLEDHAAETIGLKPVIKKTTVEAAPWIERYRESVEMIRFTDDLIVRPNWILATDDKYQLVLEPKMAFGTGSHATTRSSLRIIREKFQPGNRFLDMGCGSGILSILADQMGADYIKAVDYDLTAVANCKENFELNQVQTPFDIVTGSIEKCEFDEPYEFVCANIIRSTILSMMRQLLRLTANGGWLVLSGLLEKDETAISTSLKANHQSDFKIWRDEDWVSYLVKKG
ncbi:MAG: 50S ribosomal protein L11 methyltransferase [candidate division Zixibacteria bacterium]|nr:50S ribosomal protein L11 methyltransferase [candidate division Zixibacteria bacterium]